MNGRLPLSKTVYAASVSRAISPLILSLINFALADDTVPSLVRSHTAIVAFGGGGAWPHKHETAAHRKKEAGFCRLCKKVLTGHTGPFS